MLRLLIESELSLSIGKEVVSKDNLRVCGNRFICGLVGSFGGVPLYLPISSPVIWSPIMYISFQSSEIYNLITTDNICILLHILQKPKVRVEVVVEIEMLRFDECHGVR